MIENKFLPFWTVLRRELFRFWSIKRQTILGPLLQTFLYISIFGAALGNRISELEGVSYIVFIIPGLVFMAFAMNIFSNNASSLMQQKIMKAIDDQLASPVSNLQLMSAYALGGVIRASVITAITLGTSFILVSDLTLKHPFIFLLTFLSIGFFFSMLGVLIGLWAEKFDDFSLYETFVLQPLIFLGGVFYSASLLPGIFETLTRFNPIYYMINAVRYSMLGTSDAQVGISLLVIFAAGLILFFVNFKLFNKGYRLRA